MANITRSINQNATVAKILNGDMPNGVTPDDSIVILSDEVVSIYSSLLSGLLFNTIPENAPDELVEKRMQIFDDVIDCICMRKFGRLHRLIKSLNDATKDYQTDVTIWPNTKMRNNVFSFINDFWIWTPEERQSVLVIEEIDLDAQQAELAPAVESEVVTE